MTDKSIPSFSYRKIVQSVTGEYQKQEYTFPMFSNTDEFQEQLIKILNLNEHILKIINSETVKMKQN
jgi:hypothetical protein